ncbi:mucin-like protein [Ciona intestinalis]
MIITTANRAPTITYETNQTSTVVEGTIRVMVGQTINIQFNGSDADGDALTYSVNNNEISGTSINGSGYFTFVVTSSNLNINVSGDVPNLLVQVIDGLASAVVEVKVLVCDCAGNGTCLWDRPLQLGTPSYGVVSCQCNPAYTGLRCTEDEDGCVTNPCFVRCTDNPAPATNFTCAPCPSNMTGDGMTCVDRDECAEGSHNCAQNCTNTVGSFNCSCGDGYTINPQSPNTCTNVNECLTGSPCASFGAASCMDNDGSFSCMCNSGYQMNAQGDACQDILECNNTSTCNTTTSQCSETPGSYQCSCKTGYQK